MIKFISDNKLFQEDLRILYENYFNRKEDYFGQKKVLPTGNRELYEKAITLGVIWVSIYLTLLLLPVNSGLTIFLASLLCVLLGFANASIGFNIMHDGNHGSFSEKKWLNKLMGFSLNPLGGNSAIWRIKHNTVHHTVTNVLDHDDDIGAEPFGRFHPKQKWYPIHKWQFLYIPILIYPLHYFFWIFYFDFVKYFKGEVCKIPLNFKPIDHIIFWFSKILHVSLFVLIPLINHSFVQVLIGYAIVLGTTGLLISIVFQLAHVVTQAQMVTASESTNEKNETYEVVYENNKIHQVLTTVNFATKSKFWTWFSGGLNFQVEHHLFPKVSHIHYPKLQPFVKDICQKHGLPYNENRTFLLAVWSHLATLWNFGNKITHSQPAR